MEIMGTARDMSQRPRQIGHGTTTFLIRRRLPSKRFMITRSLKKTARGLTDILYVDNGVIVISKPPGVVSQARALPASQSANHFQHDPASFFFSC